MQSAKWKRVLHNPNGQHMRRAAIMEILQTEAENCEIEK